jgi:UDP-glucuronate decarboxylase
LCKAYRDEYGLDARIGRIFNSYGPRLRAEGLYGRVVSRFILQSRTGQDFTVFGDGSQTRSFCYVTDTVGGILLFAGSEALRGEALNIGSVEETAIIDLARQIKGLSGSRSAIRFLPFPPGDHRRRVPNIEKVMKFLHWSPRMKLDEGLKRTVAWIGSLPPTVA